MPLLNDPGHSNLIEFLTGKGRTLLGSPKAVVVVTAHWETTVPMISGNDRHDLLFDYYNFPAESYTYKYPATGSPAVAQQVAKVLSENGFKPQIDLTRGWDHGVFVPMMLLAPDANIPIVQLSVLKSQDPEELMRMGKALASLRNENIAILGSGSSFHGHDKSGNSTFENSIMLASKSNKETRAEILKTGKIFRVQWDVTHRAKASIFLHT